MSTSPFHTPLTNSRRGALISNASTFIQNLPSGFDSFSCLNASNQSENFLHECVFIGVIPSDTLCGSRKYPSPHHRGSLEIPRRRGGILKAKTLKGKYESKLEFPEGWGVQTTKPSVRGVWIFSETTQWNQCLSVR